MNTMIGYTVEQETDSTGKVLQSLLLLARNFLNHTDSGIQSRHVWDSREFVSSIPPRVWKRHSALLTMLSHQAEASDPQHNESK